MEARRWWRPLRFCTPAFLGRERWSFPGPNPCRPDPFRDERRSVRSRVSGFPEERSGTDEYASRRLSPAVRCWKNQARRVWVDPPLVRLRVRRTCLRRASDRTSRPHRAGPSSGVRSAGRRGGPTIGRSPPACPRAPIISRGSGFAVLRKAEPVDRKNARGRRMLCDSSAGERLFRHGACFTLGRNIR